MVAGRCPSLSLPAYRILKWQLRKDRQLRRPPFTRLISFLAPSVAAFGDPDRCQFPIGVPQGCRVWARHPAPEIHGDRTTELHHHAGLNPSVPERGDFDPAPASGRRLPLARCRDPPSAVEPAADHPSHQGRNWELPTKCDR